MIQRENKTEWQAPVLEQPLFTPITEEEASSIRGGAAAAGGTCVGVGIACNSKGGLRIGVCAILGVIHE
jgi:hypothetical protein